MKSLSNWAKLTLSTLLVAAACGCVNQGYSVIASSGTTIGVGISQNPTNGSVDATLGYKRAELAFVPTNRRAENRNGNTSTGNGAKDTANVLMELRYSGIFSMGDNSGIYQRLAVGDIAVRQNGASVMFAKGHDGQVDPDAAQALKTIEGVPQATHLQERAEMARAHDRYKEAGDPANLQAFDDAAKRAGFGSFADFSFSADTTAEQVETVRRELVSAGINLDGEQSR